MKALSCDDLRPFILQYFQIVRAEHKKVVIKDREWLTAIFFLKFASFSHSLRKGRGSPFR